MTPIKIGEGIYGVGVIDWNIRDFHGYTTPFGTTYNAFLIVDEKIVLIDTVKRGFEDQLLKNISEIVDPQRIDYVISNHTEMDHSGSLPYILHRIGEDTPLFCSKMGEKNLKLHFTQKWNYHSVESGEELNLGSKTLSFIETRMLHWPDSMFTYLKEEKCLFSSDAFGQHYSSIQNFDNEVGIDAITPHAKKYFANILMHLSPQITKLINKVKSMGLDIDIICPDHGIIWKKEPDKIILAYAKWASCEPKNKAVVIYDTMWKSTEKMADAIVLGISSSGAKVKPLCVRTCHRSDIITEVMDAKAIVLGSPTLNNGLYPTVSDFLTYMKGLKPKNKIAAAFGSYGWSGEAVKLINLEFESMKFKIIDSGLKVQFIPDSDDLNSCVEFGKRIGNAIIKSD
mmetsp:Transcript_479/g.306  ORF Transcript_479/g.306 Transcript_479/m.306 type:complete len:398 (+) Transcript_479:1054-2247(+)